MNETAVALERALEKRHVTKCFEMKDPVSGDFT
jgi:hypothetical protein